MFDVNEPGKYRKTASYSVINRKDKRLIKMGGFIMQRVLKEKVPEIRPKVAEMLATTVGVDETYVDKLNEMCNLERMVSTKYKRYYLILREKGVLNKWRTPGKLEEKFTDWYLEKTMEFGYGRKKEDYLAARYYIEVFGDGEISAGILQTITRLEPVELIVYTARKKMNRLYSGETDRLCEQLGAEPIFLELIDGYLMDYVRTHIPMGECIKMDKILKVREESTKMNDKKQ